MINIFILQPFGGAQTLLIPFANFADSVMDLQTLLHNLHEEVSCSVCMSPFTEPKILPCFHTFCLHCLNEIQRTSGKHGEITCPECRRKFQVPGSGYPKDLPANFRMNSLFVGCHGNSKMQRGWSKVWKLRKNKRSKFLLL